VTEQVVIERDKELTRLSAGGISASFEEFIDRLTALARLPAVFNGNHFEQRLALDGAKNQLSLFDAGVYIVDNLGSVVANLPDDSGLIGQDRSDHPVFRNMVHSPDPLLSDIEQNGPDGEDVIAIAVPILGEESEFRGMVMGMFRLDANAISPFYGTLIKLRIARSGKAYLIDGAGRVIYASDFNQIGTDFNERPNSQLFLDGQVGAVRTFSSDSRDIVAGYSPVPRTNWTLVVEEDWNELIRPSAGYRQFLLLLLVLGVLIPTIVVTIVRTSGSHKFYRSRQPHR
jgi:hypothetical protein